MFRLTMQIYSNETIINLGVQYLLSFCLSLTIMLLVETKYLYVVTCSLSTLITEHLLKQL